VGPDGIITTVAGNGTDAHAGDGGPATAASISGPAGLSVGPDGSLYIAETGGYGIDQGGYIRRVAPDGTITTVAGTAHPGTDPFGGDGGPATAAKLSHPQKAVVGPDGNLYVADTGNNRIREVTPDGIIHSVAGIGTFGINDPQGEGGAALAAQIASPVDLAFAGDDSFYVVAFEQAGGGGRIFHVHAALPSLNPAEMAVASADGSQVEYFDTSGRHLRTVDALTGAVLYRFGYDSAGRLASVTDGSGNVTTVERDASGNPTAIVAPGGQRTTLTENADGYFRSISDPAGNTVSVAYDSQGLLTGITDPRGNVHTMTYDARALLAKDADPAGGSTSLVRSKTADGFVVTVTTAEGRVSSYEHDDLPTGEMVQVITDAAGGRTEHHLSLDGSETFVYPDGTKVTLQKGPDPRFGLQAPVIASEVTTTPAGLTSATAETRTITLSNPLDALSVKTLTDTVTVNGQAYTSVFDGTARTITDTTPAGRQTVTTVDAQDRPTEVEVPGVAPVFDADDARGRLATVTQGTGAAARTETLTYNADNTVATLTDPLGHVLSLSYDAAGNVTRETLPGGQVIALGHDASGNLASLAPPGQPAHTFGYTPIDLPASDMAPDVGPGTSQTTDAYNKDRQLTQVALPDGQTVDLGYDGGGRLSTLTLPTGQIGYGYDPKTGNLTSMTAPGGVGLAYTYDGGLLTGTTWTGPVAGSVARTYDANFRTNSLGVDGGPPVTFGYDADGLLTTAGSLTLSFDAHNGLLTGTTLVGVTDAVTYDAFGAPAGYTASQGGTTLYGVQSTRDQLGRITEKVERIGGVTATSDYTYDPDGRLIRVTKDGVVVAAYTYDGNGNRLSYTGPGGTGTGTYDAQDRLLSYGGTSYSYTGSGALASKTTGGQTTTYQYDALGNLLHVTLPNGTQIDYVVDGEGRRIGKEVNGALVQGFLYQDGLRPVAELDGNGNVVATFVYGSGSNVPDYMVKGGVTYRLIVDQVGSVRLVVNAATGAVAQRLDYDEFGNVVQDTNPGFQPFGFAGGLYDRDTGLVRFGARDYDPVTGRWTAKDPIGFNGGDTNLYAYASNDPVNRNDPTGRFVIVIWGLVIAGEALFDAAVAAGIITGGVGLGAWIFHTAPPSTPDSTDSGQSEEQPAAGGDCTEPVGRRGQPVNVQPGSNEPTTIGGREYSGHALDRMQGRGVPPTVVEDAIQNGTPSPGREGSTVHSSDNATVVVGPDGKVWTVMTR
jgi:RHS repeat-associated protein